MHFANTLKREHLFSGVLQLFGNKLQIVLRNSWQVHKREHSLLNREILTLKENNVLERNCACQHLSYEASLKSPDLEEQHWRRHHSSSAALTHKHTYERRGGEFCAPPVRRPLWWLKLHPLTWLLGTYFTVSPWTSDGTQRLLHIKVRHWRSCPDMSWRPLKNCQKNEIIFRAMLCSFGGFGRRPDCCRNQRSVHHKRRWFQPN